MKKKFTKQTFILAMPRFDEVGLAIPEFDPSGNDQSVPLVCFKFRLFLINSISVKRSKSKSNPKKRIAGP